MRPAFALVALSVIALALPSLMPAAEAIHQSRVVMPYAQNERFVPVVAGYEVAPRPLGCDAGTITPSTVIFSEDFDDGTPQVTLAKDIAQVHSPNSYQNLWHVTNAVNNEKGTTDGHSGTGRLYFGRDDTGRMSYYGWRLGGTASFPSFVVPSEPAFIAWKDKFEVEGLFGYDHLWVELKDLTDGRVYILCSTDTDVRPDKSSHDGAFSTCSPYRTMLCPTGIQGSGGLDCPTAVITPVYVCLPVPIDFGQLDAERIDPTAPHWESRYVRLPTELAGHTVIPRFSYDSADGVANAYMGWMGDDVLIATGLPNPEPYAYVAPLPAP